MALNYEKKASRVIERLVAEEKKNFVIYPFGELGGIVKRILNEQFGINEIGIVDKRLSKINKEIWNMEMLKDQIEVSDLIVLIASVEDSIYSEIRAELMEYVSIDRFVDVFSPSMYFDNKAYYDQPRYTYPRYVALEACAKEIYKNSVHGNIAECGVYKGDFANHMTRLLPDRKIYLFDTFCGFDDRDIDETENEYSDDFRRKTNLSDTSVEFALSNIAYRKNAIVRKGYFPDTAKGLEGEKFSFVSLDTDLYKPIYAGLEFFYPRLSEGGYIFVDDLGHRELLGVREAVIDFCKKNHIGYTPVYDGIDETAIITKPL